MIELVTREEILLLRHRVLRPTLPIEAAMYPEDANPEIFHLADRDPDGTLIACVTFFPEPLDGEPAWRFRGMATLAERRNAGVGGRLLERGIAEVERRGGVWVWCNGRSEARAFYRRHGFVTRGEEFVLAPLNVAHYVFVRALG